jgi:hypothetical protein
VLAESQRFGGAKYDCWSGEVRSPLVSVAVQVPETEVDLAAADFLDLDHDRWKNNWKAGLISYATALYAKFPTSHYTYAAFAAAGAYSKMSDVVIAQPDNPLNPWIAGAMATNLAAPAGPCARSSEQPRTGPSHLEERYQRLVLAYPPPKAVQDYLHQQSLEHSTEECPKEAAAGGEENAQPPE